jgi:hypothetical protein
MAKARVEPSAYNVRLTKLLVDLSVDAALRELFEDPAKAEAAMKERKLDDESIAAVLSGSSARVRKALGYLQFGFAGPKKKKAAKR